MRKQKGKSGQPDVEYLLFFNVEEWHTHFINYEVLCSKHSPWGQHTGHDSLQTYDNRLQMDPLFSP